MWLSTVCATSTGSAATALLQEFGPQVLWVGLGAYIAYLTQQVVITFIRRK